MQNINKSLIIKILISLSPSLLILVSLTDAFEFFPLDFEILKSGMMFSGLLIKYIIPALWAVAVIVSLKFYSFKQNKVYYLFNILLNAPLMIIWFLLLSYPYN